MKQSVRFEIGRCEAMPREGGAFRLSAHPLAPPAQEIPHVRGDAPVRGRRSERIGASIEKGGLAPFRIDDAQTIPGLDLEEG